MVKKLPTVDLTDCSNQVCNLECKHASATCLVCQAAVSSFGCCVTDAPRISAHCILCSCSIFLEVSQPPFRFGLKALQSSRTLYRNFCRAEYDLTRPSHHMLLGFCWRCVMKLVFQGVRAVDMLSLLERGERLLQPPTATIDIYMILIKCKLTTMKAV